MKHSKKIFIIIMLLTILVGVLSISAFAATPDGKITIDNAITGEDYTLYKVFDLTYGGDGTTSPPVVTPSDDVQNVIAGTYEPVAYTYTDGTTSSVSDGFFNALSADASPFTLTKILGSNVYSVVRKTGATDAQIIKFIKDNIKKLPADRKIGTVTATGSEVKWENLAYGYYYASSTSGSLVSIDSTLKEAVIKEKNTIPTDTKQVKDSDESTETWGTDDDAQIGDTVDFKLTVTDGKGTEGYIVLHDEMSSGLTLKIDSFAVKKGSDTVAAGNYTIYVDKDLTVTGTKPDAINKSVDLSAEDITDGATEDPVTLHKKDSDTFVIIFKDTYVETLKENDVITVTYSAVLNDQAVVGTAETNKSKISYSNQVTTVKQVNVHTYDLDIIKYKANDDNKTPIAGAVFQLQLKSSDTESTPIWLTTGTAVSGYDVYEVAQNQSPDLTGLSAVTDERDTSIIIGYKDSQGTMVLYKAFVTSAEKKVRIDGLDVDKTYLLEELEAPSGYNKLAEKKEITAASTTTGEVTTKDFQDLEIENQSGTELPSTGGIGTLIFYVVGGIVLISAVVVLVIKKRSGKDA